MGFPSGQREQTVNLPSSTSKVRILPPPPFPVSRYEMPVTPRSYHYAEFVNTLPLVGFPSGQREQTVNLPSSTSKVRILPPPPFPVSRYEMPVTPRSYHYAEFVNTLPLVGFPSGQREQTVNLPSSTSKVRILPPPPSSSPRISQTCTTQSSSRWEG